MVTELKSKNRRRRPEQRTYRQKGDIPAHSVPATPVPVVATSSWREVPLLGTTVETSLPKLEDRAGPSRLPSIYTHSPV